MQSSKTISISYRILKIVGLSLLVLPLMIFLFFFVKRIISIPVIILLALACYLAIQNQGDDKRFLHIEIKQLLLIFLVCLVWCYFGGQGGYFYQTSDWNERNAIFRDLITNKWPVYYSGTNTALTYYIGHWLPAALIGRTFYSFTGLLDVAWTLGNTSLLIWTALSVFICILLLLQYISANTSKLQWLVIGIMIFFSGLDIIGCFIQEWNFQSFASILHLEWWLEGFQFSSNTTCLFWVYNQAVPAWIATLLFLNEKSNKMYALIIVCTLISAPLPCVGLAVYMVGNAIYNLIVAIKHQCLKNYLKETFTLTNIISVLFVFPILALYFMTNSALEKSNVTQIQNSQINHYAIYLLIIGTLLIFLQKFFVRKIIPEVYALSIMSIIVACIMLLNPRLDYKYVLFLLLEVGFHLLVISSEKYKCVFYYLTILLFFIAPTIKIGIGSDFCMRSTIPATIILMTMYIETLIKWLDNKNQSRKSPYKIKLLCAITILVIGMATPIMEFYRGIYKVTEAQRLNLIADDIYTLNQYHSSGNVYGNFVSENYSDSIFFKYLAQR